MVSVITLLVVLTLSILLTRVATVALTHTGLSRESAKFQARSAFTGVGFTTSESEKVVNHPIRRRILLLLMLLGNAGIVTAVSTLIVSFINIDRSGPFVWQIVLLVTGLVALWSLASSRLVDRHLSNLISKVLKKYTRLSVQDYAKLLHLAGDYQINELQVRNDDWVAGRTIAELALRREGVIVLGINRGGGRYLGAPDGDTRIEKGDVLILYGRAQVIEALDQRSAGRKGDWEHHEKIVEQEAAKEAERKEQED